MTTCNHTGKRKAWNGTGKICTDCAEEIGSQRYNEQKGKCAICGVYFGDRVNGRVPPAAHLDHDHKTGQVRGGLCQKCNQALGLFADNPEIIKKAYEYLNKWKNIEQ